MILFTMQKGGQRFGGRNDLKAIRETCSLVSQSEDEVLQDPISVSVNLLLRHVVDCPLKITLSYSRGKTYITV